MALLSHDPVRRIALRPGEPVQESGELAEPSRRQVPREAGRPGSAKFTRMKHVSPGSCGYE
ncbi:MAG TPA: hypothetical protein VF060_26465 [Trebonia sp.]